MNAMLESLKELKDYEKQAIRAIGWDPTHQIQRPAKLYLPGQVITPVYRGEKTAQSGRLPPSILSTSIQSVNFWMVDNTSEKAVYTYILNGINSPSSSRIFCLNMEGLQGTTVGKEGFVGKINQFVNINTEDPGDRKGDLLLHIQANKKNALDDIEWEIKAFLEFSS